MPYVQRDQNGEVKGIFSVPQRGYAEEYLTTNHAEVVAYLTHSTVPMEVSRYQAIEALAEAQILDEVESLMAAETTPDAVRRAWKNVQVFRRDSQMVLGMAALLGLSDADLDNLFIVAATMQA